MAVAKTKFIKAGKGARSAIREHLRYIQERERGEKEPERKFFDREKEGLERKEVFDKMLDARGDKTAIHTMILSPGDNSIDIREYTRESMKALEERLGHELDWFATIHENTDHYHAHVVIGGRIPDRERDYERGYGARGDQKFDRGNRWSNEEGDVRDVLGKGYDERPETDPREDRASEWSRWGDSDEREPTDPDVKDLLGDSSRSPEEMKVERMLDQYERQMGAKEAARERGDVYLDINDLRELRSAGNDYIHRERSLEKSLEREYEKAFDRPLREQEHEREREPEQGRDYDVDQSRWSEIFQNVDLDRHMDRNIGREYGRDDREDPEREERDRDDDRGR